jgi:hypothetical protein
MRQRTLDTKSNLFYLSGPELQTWHVESTLPRARSLVVFFIPFKEDLVRENKKGDRPCRNWGTIH